MTTKIFTAASAALLSAALLVGAPAFADNHGELVAEVTAGLNAIGVAVGDMEMSAEQAAELMNILNGTGDDEEKKMAAEQVLGM